MFREGVANPLTFRVAIFTFAWRVWFLGVMFMFGVTPCKGGYQWVPRGARLLVVPLARRGRVGLGVWRRALHFTLVGSGQYSCS